VQGQREIIRFLAQCEAVWHRRFPALHRRAQWHIASYLCTRGRTGAAVGELSGMVKQVFLLDDATVRERVSEMVALGLCTLDPPDTAVSARTIVVPAPPLLEQFDAYLLELAATLLSTVTALDPAFRAAAPSHIDGESRQSLLHAVECCRNDTIGALERVFDETGLSRARRLDARRHLLSASHWGLLLEALAHRYGIVTTPQDGDGILADQMAATLLSLIRQNFQTTRDHIAYLMQLGLLERRQGRALRVALAEPVARQFDRALAQAAAELPRITRGMLQQETEAGRTATVRTRTRPGDATEGHVLLISRSNEPDREVPISTDPIIIGRAPGSGVLLSAVEVSRAHCRVALTEHGVTATDLNSTNGTLMDGRRITGTTTLTPESVLHIGPYRLEYQRRGVPDPEATMRPLGVRQTGSA